MTAITVFDDAEAAGRALAAEIADGIEAASRDGRRYLLGCPGGRSPVATYEWLAKEVADRRLDVSGVVIVMMDDYLTEDLLQRVSPQLHYSCEKFAVEEIAGPLTAAARTGEATIWLPEPIAPGRYDDQIRAAGGIDLFILASGASDGHVAFNPPGTPADARTRVVRLADSTRHDNLSTFPKFTSIDEVPTHGVSVGTGTIAELSKRAVLVVNGQQKRQAVTRLAAATGYDPAWPATVVAICRDPSVYADRASVLQTSAPAQVKGTDR